MCDLYPLKLKAYSQYQPVLLHLSNLLFVMLAVYKLFKISGVLCMSILLFGIDIYMYLKIYTSILYYSISLIHWEYFTLENFLTMLCYF